VVVATSDNKIVSIITSSRRGSTASGGEGGAYKELDGFRKAVSKIRRGIGAMFGGDLQGGRVRREVEEEEEGRLGARLQLRSTCLVTLKRRKFKHIYCLDIRAAAG